MIDVTEANAALQEYFAPWVKALRPEVTGIGPEGAVLEIPVTDELARFGGIVSGQALAALADTAMVFACAGALGRFAPVATTNLDTQFLRPGTGETIRCEAHVVRAGKALIFCAATLTALPSGKACATAQATFYLADQGTE